MHVESNSRDLFFAIQDCADHDIVRSKSIIITGWCFAANGADINGIRARVHDRIFKASRKQTRWNVAALHPNHPQAVTSGFTVEVQLPRGVSEVFFEAKMEGKWVPFTRLRLKRPWFQLTNRKHARMDYPDWVQRFDTWPHKHLGEWERDIRENFQSGVLISILLPVYNTPEQLLRECLNSVLSQIYPYWELCVADDASTASHVRPVLEEYQRKDNRIKTHYREQNGHICTASNTALSMATGQYCALFDHDDLLTPHALYWMAREIRDYPDSILIYSDEDKLDERGHRTDPYFKSDWDPELLLGQNYLNHLTVYRTEAIREAGAFREGFEGAQDWDLALRISEKCAPSQIRHIARILYHWRITAGSTATNHGEKPYAAMAGIKAVSAALQRRQLIGHQVELLPSQHLRIIHPLPASPPRVAIIVPTRDQLNLLQRCVASLFAQTDYPEWRLIIVDHESSEPETQTFLRNLTAENRADVLRETGAFNFSRLNNAAVQISDWADVVVLLNNDTMINDPGWLRELVSQAIRPDVGAVGAALFYPSGLYQHAGVFLGYLGAAGHLARGTDGSLGANSSWIKLVRRASAVTAACLAVERRKYLEVGGMDEPLFGVAYNDVDFCLRLSAAGYHTLFTPFATVVHDESVTRGADEKTMAGKMRANREIALLQKRWGEMIKRDPYYNPNLTLEEENLGPNFQLY